MAPKQKGLTELHIQIDESDIERVRASFEAGKLAHLGFVSIEFPARPELNINSPEQGHAERHRSTDKKDEPPHR